MVGGAGWGSCVGVVRRLLGVLCRGRRGCESMSLRWTDVRELCLVKGCSCNGLLEVPLILAAESDRWLLIGREV